MVRTDALTVEGSNSAPERAAKIFFAGAGIERIDMLRKGLYQHLHGDNPSPAEHFYRLAT